jgi:hypothetical protein
MKSYIPLSSAFLCQDCSNIGNDALVCPACASTVLLPLAGVLGRETPVPRGDDGPMAGRREPSARLRILSSLTPNLRAMAPLGTEVTGHQCSD